MTKSPKTPATKRVTAKRGAAKTPARKGSRSSATVGESSRSKNILTAGFKALSNAHEEAVARQSRVFESLLGMGKNRKDDAMEKPSNPITAALDPFGFKKFEDVFDQRVARTLQHLGYPSPEAHAELKAELDALRAEVATLRASASKR